MTIPGNMLSTTTEAVDPNTSGWVAKMNCTIGLGSGGRNGDGCLVLTSAASGEMQARTFSSYPVTAGEEYWTFADASSSTQAERIGIRWLSSTAAELSVTWSMTTSASSAGWHRVSVAGIAPAGAVRAQVLVSATVGAASRQHFWENVYFGYPMRLASNMLSFNAEAGGELDLSAWAAETNCSLSRVAPAVSWAVGWYYSGGHQIALTVTSNGNASALCAERAPVTPGVEYLASAYLNPPTSDSSAWVELRFYDAGGSQVQATRSPLAAPGTGWYNQVASAVAPVGAATASVAVGITSATAAQAVRWEGAYVGTVEAAAKGAIRGGSVMPKADWDFEQGIGAWAVASGVAALARSTPWGAQSLYNSYSLTVTSSTASTSVLRSGIYDVGGAAGQTWLTEAFTKVVAGGWNYTLGIRWYDAAGAYLSTTAWASGAAGSPGWWHRYADFVAPADAAKAQTEITLTATSSSSVLQIDRPALWQGLPPIEAEAVDEHASVRLTLRELEVGQLLTVWRVAGDGSQTLVRGPDGLYDGTYVIPGDRLLVEDYEAPLGREVYYRTLSVWDDGTEVHRLTSTPVTLTVEDAEWAWLTDPFRPGIGLKVLVRQAPEWKQGIEQTVYRIRGRAAPVILSDVRGSREGDLVCWTTTDDERTALKFLLSTGNVLLWRCAPGRGETDVYVSVGEVQAPRDGGDVDDPWRLWTLPFTEVDMPPGAQAGSATWTVHDVVVENTTGYTVIDRYATVFDLATNQRRA